MTKYRSRKVEIDGVVFSSAKEASRYGALRTLLRAGLISGLKLQPVFVIEINGIKVCKYIADFEYVDDRGYRIIEDVKGFKTPVYRLKKKLFEAKYFPLTITEI